MLKNQVLKIDQVEARSDAKILLEVLESEWDHEVVSP